MLVDAVAGHGRAQTQTLGIGCPLADFGDVLDVEDQIAVAPALAKLYEDIGAAGQDAGAVTVGGKQGNSLRYGLRRGVVERFQWWLSQQCWPSKEPVACAPGLCFVSVTL